tara:strand:+ start:3009 stop:3407 length:399 start_codon:yes stop_codon:yes gene_type:complete
MLKLTKKLEYALISLSYMNINKEQLSSSKEISKKNNIPNDILAKVLQKMTRLGYIRSTKGVRGGYRLNKNIEKISLKTFIEDIEGPIGLVDCSIDQDCMQLNDCNIRSPINQININIRDFFNKILIKDIMNQ